MDDLAFEEPATPVRRRLIGVNIPILERAVTAAAGAALVVLAIRKRGLIGGLLGGLGAALVARSVSGECPAYRTLALRQGVRVQRSIIIQRPRREVFAMLRDLKNTPRYMTHITEVEELGENMSHWVAEVGPVKLEWLAEIVEDMHDLRLSWQSVPGGDLEHEGAIDLEDAPGRRGTLVTISLRFQPPSGPIAVPLEGVMGAVTEGQLATDLIRLRQLLETGEVATGVRRVDELEGAERQAVAPRTKNGHTPKAEA